MSKRWLKDFLRYINKVFLPEGKLLPRKQKPPSADTIRHSAVGMELEPIKKLYAEVVNKARRSKMLPVIGHYRVAAIDGTGIFSSRREPLLSSLPANSSS